MLKLTFLISSFILTGIAGHLENQGGRKLIPCSTRPDGTLDTFYDTQICAGGGLVFCCYIPNSSTIILRSLK